MSARSIPMGGAEPVSSRKLFQPLSPLSPLGRLACLAAAVLVLLSFLFPLWTMGLQSPQYPETLNFHVYSYKFAGGTNPAIDDIEEINTLNHYIGMAELHEENFPELKILPLFFGVSALAILLAAALSSRLALMAGTGLLAADGAGGLGSAYYKLYMYGHHLDPDAPIKMPGFTPPLLGSNHLANFDTTGSFSLGGYLLMLAGLLLIGALFLRARKIAA